MAAGPPSKHLSSTNLRGKVPYMYMYLQLYFDTIEISIQDHKFVAYLCSQPEVKLISNGSIEAVAIRGDVSNGQPQREE